MSYTTQELTAVLQKYKSGKASLERRVIAAENWWKLRNRFEEQRRSGTAAGEDFRSVSGWLHNVIVSKHADAMEAYPEPLILPREPDDRGEAALLSAVLPCILEQNAFERTWSDAMWQKLKTGTAVYRVGWDSEKLGGLGDISIERVDLLNIFWEPGVSDIQRSKFVFCTHLEDNEELEEEFPQLRGRLRGSPFTATRFLYDDAVSLEGKSTVVEAYYRRKRGGRTVLHYVKYVGDTVLYSTEGDSPQASPFRGKCPVRTLGDGGARVGQVPSSDPVASPSPGAPSVADAPAPPKGEAKNEAPGLYAHGRYPFVLDPLFPVEGSPCGYGFVDLCHNNQTAIDLMRSAIIKNTVVGATPRYFQRIDGSVNEEEFADLSRPLVHVSGNLGEDSLRQIGFSPLSGVYMDVLNSSIQELRETSGNTETSTGNISSGVTAASAIAALQEASGKGSRDATRSAYLAYAEIIELCIELIRQFYGLPRSFRIAGRSGAEEYIRFSNLGLGAREERYGAAPVFDVKVSAQKRSAYSRLSQNELAMELYRMGIFSDGHELEALSCLQMMEFDGRDELINRINAALGLRERLDELQKYKALALAFARRYRPDMAAGLLGEDAAPAALSEGAQEDATAPKIAPEQSAESLAHETAQRVPAPQLL